MPKPLQTQTGLTEAAIRLQLERILASRTFSHAQRLRTMLRFLVERTLDGRGEELKESVIGHEVCGRPASFDPKADPIVRVDANRLRSRLATYYETEGAVEVVRISLPKGSYVPAFGSAGGGDTSSSQEDYGAIAVLPFVNLSGVADQEFFSDSLTEQIIHRLSRLSGLRVIARSSVFQFKGRTADVRTAGKQLRVDYILDGSVRVVDGNLRITVEMSDVRTAYVLWSDRYERPWERILDVEEEIAASVTDALRIRLDRQSVAVLAHATENAEAYAHYLRGRYLWNQRTPESLEASLLSYEKALANDPQFAAAHAGVADTLLVMALNDQLPTLAARARARSAARQALELQPGSTEALVSVAGTKAVFDWDWEGSERDMQKALQMHPGSAAGHYLYAVLVLQPLGRWTEAHREMELALRLDPVSPVLLRDFGMLQFMQRDWARAEEIFSRLEETAPGFRGALYWRARLCIEQGRCEEAVHLLESRITAGRANTRVTATLAYAWGRAGEARQARKIVDRFVADAVSRRIPPVDLTMAYLAVQRWEEALDWLTKACEERAAVLYQFGIDPLYDPIRRDPRAETVRRSIGLPALITLR
jgi:serine/threonine-protein kinase